MRNTKFILAAVAALASAPAFAADYDLQVNANVANACDFNAGPDVTVDMSAIRTGVTQSGNVQIWCTNGYAVQVSAASGVDGFQLVDGANTIPYSFTSGGSAFTNVAFTGTGVASYSDIPYTLTFAPQNPAAGTYSDTITFTVAP